MKPDRTNQAEIDAWRKKEERRRLRRTLIGKGDYGWDNRELKVEEDDG